MGERLRQILEVQGPGAQAKLARDSGVDEATISALALRGSTRSQHAPALARALGRSLHWFLTGEGDEFANLVSEPNVGYVKPGRSRLPLISWVSAGLRDEANDPYAAGNAEAWVDFDSEASSSAFCLKVRGDSMMSTDGSEPTFPDGCIIAVEPRRKPKSREFAVFRFTNADEATFKMYVSDGPLKMLKPLNTSYPNIVLGPDAVLVGTVFEKRIITSY